MFPLPGHSARLTAWRVNQMRDNTPPSADVPGGPPDTAAPDRARVRETARAAKLREEGDGIRPGPVLFASSAKPTPMDRKTFLRASGCCAALAALQQLGCASLEAASEPATGQGTTTPGSPSSAQPLTPADRRVAFAETWAKRFFDVLDSHLDEETREAIMRANGKACHEGSQPGQKAAPVDIDTFIAGVRRYMGEDAIRRDGNVVEFRYVQNPRGLKVADGYCLCPLVETGPAGLSGTYCWCSVGYVQHMFETEVGRPAKVELLESLKRGGKGCRFRVTLG